MQSAGISIVNYDNVTIGMNGSSQLEVKDAAITTAKLAAGVLGISYIDGGAGQTANVAKQDIDIVNITAGQLAANDMLLIFVQLGASGAGGQATANLRINDGTNTLDLADFSSVSEKYNEVAFIVSKTLEMNNTATVTKLAATCTHDQAGGLNADWITGALTLTLRGKSVSGNAFFAWRVYKVKI